MIPENMAEYYKCWKTAKKQKKEIVNFIEDILKDNLEDIPVGEIIEVISLEVSDFGLVIELDIEDDIEFDTKLIMALNEKMGVNGILSTYCGVKLVYNIIESDGGI